MAFCDCFYEIFSVDCGSQALNLPPVLIGNSPHPNKIDHYTSDTLPTAIYYLCKLC